MNVIITIGAPGSGKSTWAKNKEGYVYLSTDAARAELGTGENDQSVSSQAFELIRNRLSENLQRGNDVIIDATNMYVKARNQFIDICQKYDANVHAIVFKLDKNELMKRNTERGLKGGRCVPENVIDSMLNRYAEPTFEEGFSSIEFYKQQ